MKLASKAKISASSSEDKLLRLKSQNDYLKFLSQISDEDLIVFTDGSCINNGGVNSSASIGVHFPHKQYQNNWKTKNNKPVKHRQIFEDILKLSDSKNGQIKYIHVLGHVGIQGNEKADQLAKSVCTNNRKNIQLDDANNSNKNLLNISDYGKFEKISVVKNSKTIIDNIKATKNSSENHTVLISSSKTEKNINDGVYLAQVLFISPSNE
ncbi:MAG: hypothetical protein MHPSP_002967 [Paramarteilia canceri]